MFSKIPIVVLLTMLVSATAYAQDAAVDTATVDTTVAHGNLPHHTTQLNLSPSLDVSITSDSKEGSEVISAEWLSALSARVFMDGEPDQFGGRVDATYGQHISELVPEKTQDDLIISVTPSRTIIPSIGLRLFLEVTGETQFTKGHVDTAVTNFVDPLFLYQSFFLGKRVSGASEDGSMTFDLTAGVGYALQQTVANSFVLQQNRNIVVAPNSPLNQAGVTIESGYSAIVDFNYSNDIATNLKFTFGAKTVGLTKGNLGGDLKDARITSLFSLGFQYKLINLSYRGHLVYDRNVSLRRELSQFLGFGLKADL